MYCVIDKQARAKYVTVWVLFGCVLTVSLQTKKLSLWPGATFLNLSFLKNTPLKKKKKKKLKKSFYITYIWVIILMSYTIFLSLVPKCILIRCLDGLCSSSIFKDWWLSRVRSGGHFERKHLHTAHVLLNVMRNRSVITQYHFIMSVNKATTPSCSFEQIRKYLSFFFSGIYILYKWQIHTRLFLNFITNDWVDKWNIQHRAKSTFWSDNM